MPGEARTPVARPELLSVVLLLHADQTSKLAQPLCVPGLTRTRAAAVAHGRIARHAADRPSISR
jgi:hypothetical protein